MTKNLDFLNFFSSKKVNVRSAETGQELFTLETGQELFTLPIPKDVRGSPSAWRLPEEGDWPWSRSLTTDLSWSPDGRYLADRSTVWDVATRKIVLLCSDVPRA